METHTLRKKFRNLSTTPTDELVINLKSSVAITGETIRGNIKTTFKILVKILSFRFRDNAITKPSPISTTSAAIVYFTVTHRECQKFTPLNISSQFFSPTKCHTGFSVNNLSKNKTQPGKTDIEYPASPLSRQYDEPWPQTQIHRLFIQLFYLTVFFCFYHISPHNPTSSFV